MKMNPSLPSLLRRFWRTGCVLTVAAATAANLAAQAPVIETDHTAYLPGEDIVIAFRNGPGNPKDWIGLYPDGVVPGSQASIRWTYTDAAGGATGLTEGTVTFAGGLALANDYAAFLLVNDGYTQAAQTKFKIIDPSLPLVRTGKRTYAPGAPIDVTFSNGPGNPKDWIGIYPADKLPGTVNATIWFYVDGTAGGSNGKTDGTINFTSGLPNTGRYVAYFLLNDGYDILASENFSVADPETKPRVRSLSPANNSVDALPVFDFTGVIVNSTSKVVPSSVRLSLDGSPVTPTVTTADNLVTVSYSSETLLAPSSKHAYRLTFSDDATPPNVITTDAEFTVAAYRNLVLPQPLFLETFNTTDEGKLPAGWTELSYTDTLNPEFDLGNLDSASYATWTVVSADRFKGSFVTYSNPDNPAAWGTDYQRVLTLNPMNVVNGKFIRNLADGRLAFGNSGYREGRSQVLYLFSPDVDLTGRTDIFLSFHSVWEQNQDSIGAVEYSVDQGQTWLPIVYMLDSVDVLKDAAGAVDAVATLTAEYGDVARYTDPDTGEEKGGSYGAFIGAAITPALAPFISARVNDDPKESKRVELFRLPAADNKPKVRLRFAHAGTDSWYFGVDNVGFYSIPAINPPTFAKEPADTTVWAGDRATLSAQANGVGPLTYQWFYNSNPIDNAKTDQYVIYPATASDAGKYSVKVTNAGGTVQSREAVLTVNPIPDPAYALWNFENGDLGVSAGAGLLTFASAETQSLTLFETADIGGQPAKVMHVPAFVGRPHGYNLTMPMLPLGAEGYINRYTFIWDVLVPGSINWTPFFNTDPGNGNDADFYVSDGGALGIGALGYSANGVIQQDTWYRIAFSAHLPSGAVSYYVNGTPVRNRTGASLSEGRFALYSDKDAGPDVRLFNEPTGNYTHEVLLNSMFFTARAMTPAEIKALGGPTAAGIPAPVVKAPIKLASVSVAGGNISLSWTGGSGPFQVQKASSIAPNAGWQNVGAETTGNTFTEAVSGGMGFYRVVGK